VKPPYEDGQTKGTKRYGPSGLKFLPFEKANVIADGLENQVSPHDVSEENHVRKVVTRVQALSEAVDEIL
jgi:hypothetical protein